MRIDRGYGFEDVPVVEDHDHDEDRAWDAYRYSPEYKLPEERANDASETEESR